MNILHTRHAMTLALILALPSLTVRANPLQSSQQQVEKTHQQDTTSQKQLDQIDAQTRQALAQYQQNQRQADLIEAYNRQLAKMVDSQQQEKKRVSQQIASLNETEQTALPMLVSLYQQLADFVHQDLPFLPQERQQRLVRLQQIINRADVSLAEKYRQVLDAYQVEIDYAQSIGSYQGPLHSNTTTKQVQYFRLGRLALYYQTLDGSQGALWQPKRHSWQQLSRSENQQLSIAIAMANKQHIPQLLDLPMPQEPKS
ncbi:DUF3450 domain-containing protein [Celerinatantimonas yamalensis]|uniref:DUF3450 domain-containing protein n=1 Tax=Celerinatantimonas yamalensis TaxID=559956 RepID=A0ABW9G6D1_9GAMM